MSEHEQLPVIGDVWHGELGNPLGSAGVAFGWALLVTAPFAFMIHNGAGAAFFIIGLFLNLIRVVVDVMPAERTYRKSFKLLGLKVGELYEFGQQIRLYLNVEAVSSSSEFLEHEKEPLRFSLQDAKTNTVLPLSKGKAAKLLPMAKALATRLDAEIFDTRKLPAKKYW